MGILKKKMNVMFTDAKNTTYVWDVLIEKNMQIVLYGNVHYESI